MKKCLICASILLVGCSPLKTSPHDEKYQWELTLHEVQTNLDDLRHDTNCFETEIQILDSRIKCFENALANLKQQEIEKQQIRIDQIAHQLQLLDRKWTAFEKKQETSKENVDQLTNHAKETGIALSQFKNRIVELESEILTQGRKLETIAKLKDGLMKSARTYKVKAGDSLEKIAKAHKTDVVTLKQINHLQNDLIVVDQELNVP
jgi:LysM repeat protein